MKRCFALPSLAVLNAVSSLLALSSGAQPDYIIRSDVRLVLLDVSVMDPKGQFVSGLTRDNFRVFENGRLQPITVFANNDLPVTVGILVDESSSMRPKRNDVLTAALIFIEESNPHDEIFVLNFNDRVTRGLPQRTLFSGEIVELRAALARGAPEGKTALNDAIVAGLEQLELGRRDKKALVVISDGGDNASVHRRREMLHQLERSIATVYTIGLYDADNPDRDPGILRQVARISGGEAYFPPDAGRMIPICRRIAKDIRSRYTIGYTPEPGMRSLRQIRIRVTAKDHARLTAHTRTSYRYDEVEHE